MKIFDFFQRPEIFWNFFWLIPLFIFTIFYAFRKRRRICQAVLGERYRDPGFTTLSRTGRNLRFALLGIAFVLLLIAAARPSWGNRVLPTSGRGRDLMIVLDVSKSMLAEDVKPSRLEHAKWFLRELVRSLPGDRFGLVAFSGSAFLECPMTIDKTSIFQMIDEMSTSTIPLGGTNIQKAVETALAAFDAAESGHRAIILVSDGDELQGDVSKTAEELQKRKIPVFFVGVGDPTQPGLIMVPDEKTGKKVFHKDSRGELVKSQLNENAMRKFTEQCGNQSLYVRSTATDPNLTPLLERIKKLAADKYQDGKNLVPIERFHLPLFSAVLILLNIYGDQRNPQNDSDRSCLYPFFFCEFRKHAG